MNVDPNLPTRLLYGTRTKGLYESRDSAATWQRVRSFPAVGDSEKPAKNAGVVFTLFDASSGKSGSATPVAFSGVCTIGAEKLFRTTDAGGTWQPIPGQPAGRLLATRAALTPDGRTLFVTFLTGKDFPGPWGADGGAVYRCDDPAGEKPVWTNITPQTPPCGWSGVCLDPQSPQTILVTTLNLYGTPGDDIYRSRDGGKSWSPLRIRQHRDDTGYPYVTGTFPHWLGDVQINPHDPNQAIFTTGYGLYRTTNLRADEPTWTFFNKGFEQSAVLQLVSPASGSSNLLSAIGDRDGYRHEDFASSPKLGHFGQVNDAGQTQKLGMATCNDLDVARRDANVVVRVGAGSQWSGDGGVTWQTFPGDEARNSFTELRLGERGPSAGHVAVAADGSAAVWTPAKQAALVAGRAGRGFGKWEPVSGLPVGKVLIAADAVDANAFFAVASDGSYRSTDGGRTFTRLADASPGKPLWLRATPGHAGHLWLTAGEDGDKGLWRSTDGGKTWGRVAADVIPVAKQVGVGAAKSADAYPAIYVGGTVAGQRGFFRSDDAGRSWIRVNDDAHQYGNVTVIQGDARVWGRLYVGTNGRGILYAEPLP
ncbi:MAG: hypothetical protein QM754_03410 [Tepidisphaeraceae bacterium]